MQTLHLSIEFVPPHCINASVPSGVHAYMYATLQVPLRKSGVQQTLP